MSSFLSPCDADLPAAVAGHAELLPLARDAGATAIGIADAVEVDSDAADAYSRWIADGRNGTMDYLARYGDVRRDPRLLLDGAQSLIVAAFNYMPPSRQPDGMPRFADYALGTDYHEVVRERLGRFAEAIRVQWGGETRVCVDTAPLMERYWAVRSGLGFVGRNSQLILPGRGSRFFIGTVITTTHFAPDAPCTLTCGDCRRCVSACPGGAIAPCGDNACAESRAAAFDARRCISYLTIEHRGPLPDGLRLGNRIYGCDACQDVCPHNRHAMPTDIPEFIPRPSIMTLTASDIATMSPEQFSAIFRHSAVKRTKLAGLQRNLTHCDQHKM